MGSKVRVARADGAGTVCLRHLLEEHGRCYSYIVLRVAIIVSWVEGRATMTARVESVELEI